MTPEPFDALFAGNNLTTLVAASKLVGSSRRVCVVNPLPNWGGHFTRFGIGDLSFDPGSISHEFTTFNDEGARDPLTYDPKRRNDAGRFVKLIEEFTRSHIDLVQTPEPETVYGGAFFRDIVMSNHFDVLHHPVLSARIKSELEFLARTGKGELHPRHKKDSRVFQERSYYEISVENHGSTLHSAIFEPMFFKMSGVSTTRLMALYHRIAWLPLYYPETLRSQFGEQPQNLQDTHFWYPKLGRASALPEALLGALEASGVEVIRQGVTRLQDEDAGPSIVLSDGSSLRARRVIWSLSHDPLITSVTGGPPSPFERWSAVLLFATIERHHLKRSFSVLYTPDDRTLFYRATNQSHCAGLDEDRLRIVIEINPQFARARGFASEESMIGQSRLDLSELGIIDDPGHLEVLGSRALKNVILLPSGENLQLLETERAILQENFPRITFTRNVEAFFNDTLNDQIIKGLKLAKELEHGGR